MRKISLILVIIILTVFSVSCVKCPEYTTDSVFALDTVITVKVVQDNAESNLKEMWDLISVLEKQLSRTNGEVASLNDPESIWGDVSDDLYTVIKRSAWLSEKTCGAYDPTVAGVVDLWGITSDAPRVPSDGEISDALYHTGVDKLAFDDAERRVSRSDAQLKLDLGGSGKGYVCQKATELLSTKGGYGIVSFGSSIGVFGQKKDGSGWNIGITDPYDPNTTLGYVTVPDGYISVSGDYERFAEIDGKKYCHIIDPSTGRPANNGIHSVVVWNHDGLEGDVISTALFVLGEDGLDLLKNAGLEFEALIVSDRGRTMTDGMKEIITLNN